MSGLAVVVVAAAAAASAAHIDQWKTDVDQVEPDRQHLEAKSFLCRRVTDRDSTESAGRRPLARLFVCS